VALASLAAWQGAQIIHVHDVRASADAVRMINAVRRA
jgi:dihydropteroate synthase